MKFTIITPTTGNAHLRKLLESVNLLNIPGADCVEHLLVIDGEEFELKTKEILNEIPLNNPSVTRRVMQIPFNTGGGKDLYLGHKIYAGVTQLVDADYIVYLDEDNFLQPDHIQSYSETIQAGQKPLEWCFCLRNVVDQSGQFVCKDECESLGNIQPVFYDKNSYFIDTNCFCVSREVAIRISHVFNRPGEIELNVSFADRVYSATIMNHFKHFTCSGKFTLNYRTSSRPGSVQPETFLRGNRVGAFRPYNP